MLAAQLNELGVAGGEVPARPARQNGRTAPLPAEPPPVAAAVVDSDSDEDDERGAVRNDGTLLASDPPKPL